MLLVLQRACVLGLVVACALQSNASNAQQLPPGTIGWDSRAGGHFNPTVVHLPTAAQACDQWAKWHMGTWVDHIEPRLTATPSYDCWYPHSLVAGGIHAYAETSLACESGYAATPDGCVKEAEPPGPPACSDTGRADSPNVGNPVVVATGTKRQRFVDFASGGPMPVVLARSYTGRGQRPRTSLGMGWTTTFDRELWLNASSPTKVIVYREDGGRVEFAGSGSNWTATQSDVVARLTRVDSSTWTFTNEYGGVDTFKIVAGTRGQLMSTRTRYGYTQRLEYDADGKLDLVIDSFGRILDFTWDGQALNQVLAPGDTLITYHYDRELVGTREVPGTERLIGVDIGHSDGTQTTSETYLYEDSTFGRRSQGSSTVTASASPPGRMMMISGSPKASTPAVPDIRPSTTMTALTRGPSRIPSASRRSIISRPARAAASSTRSTAWPAPTARPRHAS